MSDRLARRAGPWQPWRMRDLPPSPAATAAEERPENGARAAADLARQLAALREDARRRGHAEGFAAGREEGRRAGLEAGRKEGLALGREEGRREIEETLRADCERTLEAAGTLVAEWEDALARLDDEVATAVVDLALCVGHQLARDALDLEPRRLLPLVRELLRGESLLSGKPVLHLHPADLLLVREHLAAELEEAGWHTQADETLQRGGCRLEAGDREIDASWDERWRAVRAQVPRPRRRRSSARNKNRKKA